MADILARGETVYECDVCKRALRIPSNPVGMDVMQRCIITKDCRGTLHKVTSSKKIADTPTITPSVEGVDDWFQRTALFDFGQKNASITWIIDHNMGIVPTVQVFVNREDVSTGKVVLTETFNYTLASTAFRTTVTFDVPESGVAQCLSLTSNTLIPIQDTTAQLTQLTNAGELTIATTNSAPSVNVTLRYTDTNTGDFVDVTYTSVDYIPSLLSPWVGVSTAMIGGKKYYIRSFNIISTPGGNAYFQNTADLSSGRLVSFPVLQDKYNTDLLLLGKKPYSAVDRITTSYVDLGSTKADPSSVVLAAGELFVRTPIIRSTYPPILSL